MPLYSILFISFALGALGAWIISRWGNVFNLLDRANHRSSHEGVIPKGGGIGILAAFAVISLLLEMPVAFWLPAAIISLISLFGDRVEISPRLRLPIQLVAALFFVLFSSMLSEALQSKALRLFSFSSSSLAPHALPLTIFFALFIVATANWYNFMDGINGIAGITGIVGFSLLALFNHLSGGDDVLTFLPLCIAFACLGFLPFNFPKAKVFMGDVGSILLGFVFASLVVLISKSFLNFVSLAGFLFPFYADEFVTVAVRLKDGENLLKPHRRHFYQLLANEMGIPHWKVSAGYGLLQVIAGICILLLRPFGIIPVFSLLIFLFVLFIFANLIIRTKVT